MKRSLTPLLFALACAPLFLQSAVAHDGSLPLGDGKLSTQPQAGHLYSCMQRFNSNAPGASGSVPWIRGTRWYPAEKAVVDGNVRWPDARITVSREGSKRVVRTNDLPSHPSGVFPIASSDDAYRWDRNPNRIREQNIVLSLPADPELAASASCAGGEVGFLLTGVLMFSAIDAGGRDAVAHETQDSCNGHPQRSGLYHYHGPSACINDAAGKAGKHSDLVGYAFDGFGIYGLRGENGRELKSADLDACHGHVHSVLWDGGPRKIYHYHLTPDFPYSVGCLRGTPTIRGPINGSASGGEERREGMGGMRPPRDGMGPPPDGPGMMRNGDRRPPPRGEFGGPSPAQR